MQKREKTEPVHISQIIPEVMNNIIEKARKQEKARIEDEAHQYATV